VESGPPAQEEGAREAPSRPRRDTPAKARVVVSVVTAVHFYVTDLDRAMDFYSRVLGYGPQAAYDEGENAHSAFFVLDQRTYLVLTWDPDRGREVGGSSRLELAADDLEREIDGLRARGIEGGHVTRTRFGNEVYDLADPDGHLLRFGPAWTLHAIEGAV
jgi:catechol 2,3-dioxygenase-like lactoylglutathione lyase family enzyme